MGDVRECARCGEPLPVTTIGKRHRTDWNSTWDSCFRAAQGDDERIARVHRRMAESEPLLARHYDGDR